MSLEEKKETEEIEIEKGVEGDAKTEETPAAKGSETKQPQDYAKVQQQIDQERANARRAKQALENAEAEKEQMSEQLTTLQSKLTALEGQLQEQLTTKEYTELANLDPDTTDVPDVVRAHQKLVQKMKDLEKENTEMKQFVAELRTRDRQTQQEQAHKSMLEEIYSACDEDYGAQFRNEAIRLADAKVDSGDVTKPTNLTQGLRLMQKCYAEIAAKKKPASIPKKSVPTDTGLRGLSVTDIQDSEEFKPGTLDEVTKDMKKKMAEGKWKRAFTAT